MATFILPTSGPATYRGKFPARPRSISHGTTGTHIELNDGTRLWTAARNGVLAALRLSDKPDLSATLDSAVRMTAEQYERLREAAALLRTRADIAGHGRRARLEADVRAMVESIQPDEAPEAETGGAPVRLVQTRGPDGESRLVRPDSPEAKAAANRAAGLAAYRRGDHASEAEADEADERAAKVSPDAARALGAQSCACNLDRSANPFPADSAAGEAWDSGFSEAMADWRAERRAEIADRYGDEAADHF